MVALDMPPARELPGTLVEPSLNLQQRTEAHLHTTHTTRLLNPQLFFIFILSWLLDCPQTGAFSLLSAQFILLVSFLSVATAFFTSQVTEAAITLQTLDCHCWQNETEGAGGERFYSVITKEN